MVSTWDSQPVYVPPVWHLYCGVGDYCECTWHQDVLHDGIRLRIKFSPWGMKGQPGHAWESMRDSFPGVYRLDINHFPSAQFVELDFWFSSTSLPQLIDASLWVMSHMWTSKAMVLEDKEKLQPVASKPIAPVAGVKAEPPVGVGEAELDIFGERLW